MPWWSPFSLFSRKSSSTESTVADSNQANNEPEAPENSHQASGGSDDCRNDNSTVITEETSMEQRSEEMATDEDNEDQDINQTEETAQENQEDQISQTSSENNIVLFKTIPNEADELEIQTTTEPQHIPHVEIRDIGIWPTSQVNDGSSSTTFTNLPGCPIDSILEYEDEEEIIEPQPTTSHQYTQCEIVGATVAATVGTNLVSTACQTTDCDTASRRSSMDTSDISDSNLAEDAPSPSLLENVEAIVSTPESSQDELPAQPAVDATAPPTPSTPLPNPGLRGSQTPSTPAPKLGLRGSQTPSTPAPKLGLRASQTPTTPTTKRGKRGPGTPSTPTPKRRRSGAPSSGTPAKRTSARLQNQKETKSYKNML